MQRVGMHGNSAKDPGIAVVFEKNRDTHFTFQTGRHRKAIPLRQIGRGQNHPSLLVQGPGHPMPMPAKIS